MTYLFLSEGAAGISAGGVQLGAGLSPSQQLLGICIISLAIILVNIVFNVIAFRENGRISRRSYCKESERQHLENDSIERYYMLKERYLQPRFDEVRVGDNSIQLYRDGYELYAAMLAAIDEQTILLTNASFVPDHSVLEALTAAVGRGVDVRILMPWQSRHNLANKVTCSSFTQCLQAGMHLYISR